MHRLFELLESSGFISERDLGKVDELPKRKFVKFYEAVYSIVFSGQYPDSEIEVDPIDPPNLDPFSFMASASMRADSGCLELGCRLRKLACLARYAALYSNQVTLPLSLKHPDKVSSFDSARDELFRSMTSLFVMRSLIEGKIVQPVVMRTLHCEHIQLFVHEMSAFVHEVARSAARPLSDSFEVEYQLPDKSPTGRSSVYITGPEEFIEHGELVVLFDESQTWRAKSWKYDDHGKTLLKGRKKSFFVEHMLNTIANDTTFYLASGQQHRSRLLTDRPGEAYLLNWLNQDEKLQSTTKAMEFLNHSVPLLTDIPLSTVLRIRREERESFESYRRAITGLTTEVLAEKKGLSVREAKEAFKTRLEPRIEKIRAEVAAERKKQKRRLTVGASSLAASVLIGAVGGIPILFKMIAAGVAAAAGAGPLRKAAESTCDHGAEIRQKNDLYFLLRLIEEG